MHPCRKPPLAGAEQEQEVRRGSVASSEMSSCGVFVCQPMPFTGMTGHISGRRVVVHTKHTPGVLHGLDLSVVWKGKGPSLEVLELLLMASGSHNFTRRIIECAVRGNNRF